MSYHPSHCTCARCAYPAPSRRMRLSEATLLCAVLLAGLIAALLI